jgi:hypothetical protein
MSARPTSQLRRGYKLFLRNCLSSEWLSCLVCFRKHQIAIQRLTLLTFQSETSVEVEFAISSASTSSTVGSLEKHPLLDDLESQLGEMHITNWDLNLVSSPQKQ